jgi:hypothetical protein
MASIEVLDLVALGGSLPADTDHAITGDLKGEVLLIRLEPGRAYPTDDGIYLDVRSVEDYGLLAHQSLDQLKLLSGTDLTQIVLSATGFKQIFRSSDMLSRDYLARMGGEAMYHKLSWSQPVELAKDLNGMVS